MGTNVSLTPVLEQFARQCVESGRYDNVSEVVRAAMRLLQDQEDARTAFVQSLEEATAESMRDGFLTADEVAASARTAIAEAHDPQS